LSVINYDIFRHVILKSESRTMLLRWRNVLPSVRSCQVRDLWPDSCCWSI